MKKYLPFLIIAFLFTMDASAQLIPDAFVATYRITTPNESLNINRQSNYNYNYTVDWGDGSPLTTTTSSSTHSYATPGDYDVSISGIYPARGLQSSNLSKLIEIKQWGNIVWGRCSQMFAGASNLTIISAIDAPDLSQVTSTSDMFSSTSSLANPDLNHWDVSNINFMGQMFLNSSFNGDIGNWNTSNVTDMYAMFESAALFNNDISNWNTSSVTSFSRMFRNATAFNQSIGNWNTSSLQGLGLENTFNGAQTFNQPIGNWDISGITSLSNTFSFAHSFNQDLNNWDVSNVTNMNGTFNRCFAFNQPLNTWDTSSVQYMGSLFNRTAFDQDISTWNTSQVIVMSNMFSQAATFNQDISSWNMSNVTEMRNMFNSATAFNQDIGTWDTSSVTTMESMFQAAASFNQDISGWDISQVTTMQNILKDFNAGTSFSIDNYSRLLDQWSQQNVQPNVRFDTSIAYCTAAQAARDALTNNPNNWTINDLGVNSTASCTLSNESYDSFEVDYSYDKFTRTLLINSSQDIIHLNIYNLSGQLVKNTSQSITDLSSVKDGLYIVQVSLNNSKTTSFKFVKY